MSNSETMYKEMSLFNDIANPSHRAWNRLMIVSNLREAGRPADAANYLDKLDKEGKAALGLLVLAIKNKGLEAVKAELNRSIVKEKEGA